MSSIQAPGHAARNGALKRYEPRKLELVYGRLLTFSSAWDEMHTQVEENDQNTLFARIKLEFGEHSWAFHGPFLRLRCPGKGYTVQEKFATCYVWRSG